MLDTAVKEKFEELSPNFTDSFVKNDRFYSKHYTAEGKEFFIFSKINDLIEGIIIGRRSNSHINRTNSYRIQAYSAVQNGIKIDYGREGDIQEFFANRQLQQIFEQNEVRGKYIKIVFIGRQKVKFSGHSLKVYRVYINKGVMRDEYVEILIKNEAKRDKQKSTNITT